MNAGERKDVSKKIETGKKKSGGEEITDNNDNQMKHDCRGDNSVDVIEQTFSTNNSST